jgi:high-affinity nickel-transport protein
MGLIGENCAQCSEAADDPNGGGLSGAWWRFWASVSFPPRPLSHADRHAQANDNSGYIGAGIVGVFAVTLLGYHLSRWYYRTYRLHGKQVLVERHVVAV